MAQKCQPLARTGHVAVAWEDFMVVWGGYKEQDDSQANVYFSGSVIWLYDVLTEKWILKRCLSEEVPPGTSGAVAILSQDYLYIFGGYQEEGNTNALYCLSLLNFKWELLHPKGYVPTPVDKLVGWEYNCKLYFFGGFGIIPESYVKEQSPFLFIVGDTFSTIRRGWTNQFIAYDPVTNEWTRPTTKGNMPVPRAAHAAALVDNKVFIFGGRHHNTRMNDLHCLNMETMEWSGPLAIEGSVPEGRSWHSLNALSKQFLVLYGGFSQNDVPLCDCWILDLVIMKWRKMILPFEKPRLWHTACVSKFQEIIIYGGCTGNILDHRRVAEHAKDIIILMFSPKSLFRLCFDVLVEYPEYLTKNFSNLPASVVSKLKLRLDPLCSSNLDGS